MISKNDFPILEFDSNKNSKINPSSIIAKKDVPKCCVITFFGDVIEQMLKNDRLKQIGTFATTSIRLPIYETEYSGKRIGIIAGFLGAAGSAGQLEELIAMGFKKFIVCGGAGVLQKGIQVGHLVVPYSAIRDEGLSYHYLEPSREVECDFDVLDVIENQLSTDNIPYIKAKTWTTDAFYRETEDKVKLRVSEGCVTVEMEAAAFFAISKFRGVKLGLVLYGGDDLSGVEWDSRKWNSRENIRKNLVELSFKICLKLK
ncbi:nucleoside phosphorylase [Sedimentibacter sp. zth1]|uniref:nucleoside phosphorylase n=1 Tax=Sedimentibacter sp. zth1 TaxID=2816908 RepID=UPI001A92E565|nr:nucleoside phosphorylase [Sedimentibacter sp. zth1]QSX06467.1 nucleoside phosphorylase [Sedimentibacter sp. zth1]